MAQKQAVKGKAKAAETTEELSPIEQAVLKYANAQLECEALEELPIFKERDEAKKALLKLIDEQNDAAEKGSLKVDDFKVDFTAKRSATNITDISEVRALLGNDVFLKLATVPLKDLKVYLTPPEYDQVTETERTGARTLKVKKL